MLPPRLATLRASLANQPYSQRSTDQDALLEELAALDEALTGNEPMFNEPLLKSGSRASRVGVASGKCQCCGK